MRRASRRPDLRVPRREPRRRWCAAVPGGPWARLRRSPDPSRRAPDRASRAGSGRVRAARRAPAVSTRCAPLVITSSGSSSHQNTRLLAMAPTSTPSAAAASGAVAAASGSTTISPVMPARAKRVVDEAAAGGEMLGHASQPSRGRAPRRAAGAASRPSSAAHSRQPAEMRSSAARSAMPWATARARRTTTAGRGPPTSRPTTHGPAATRTATARPSR